jgi:D-alanyl-D-alanine endopeptidase (penicillin-binding protein 7)
MKFILYIVLMLSSQVALAGTTAPAYAIWNVDTGHMLAGNNSDGVRSMASITKLMTVLVTLRSNVKLDESVTVVGQESSSRIRRGMTLTRNELIDLALVASDNLASRTLAESSGMTYEEFIWTMNRTAASLGMTSTSYTDSTGLLSTNVSTAMDIKLLVQETERWRVFHDTAMAPTSTIAVWVKNKVRSITFNNTNRFAGQLNLIGAKTGTTTAAGKCLTMFFVENGQRYVLVVMGARSSDQRHKMVTKLIDIIK